MIRKHLFLKLYHKGFQGFEKPLTEYIKDFDKTVPLKFYEYGKTDRPLQRIFRNLDELFLHKNAITNNIFASRYLKSLQNMDLYEDITLHEVYELSLLKDKDKSKHPNTQQFKDAYISDSRRAEIVIYESYYRFLLWRDLGCTDLELSRRVDDCLFNSVTSNNISLDDGIGFKNNPFIDYNKSNNIIAIPSDLKAKQDAYVSELRECEESLLERIKIPNGVLFDGNRFTVCIPNSPMSLMFDIKKQSRVYNVGGIKSDMVKSKRFVKTNHKHYQGGINIQHPTQLQPAFINRNSSERCGSWWNGRTTWDYTWRDVIDEAITLIQNGISDGEIDANGLLERMELISFILLMKNGGNIKGTDENIIDVIKAYKTEKQKIKAKYKKVINAQVELASTLMKSYSNRGISLFYESRNGYVVATYYPYNLSETRKLDSKAVFFDKDFKQIGVSEFYSDLVVDSTYKKKYFDGGFKDLDRLRNELSELTFKKLAEESRIIAVDYESFNTQTHLMQIITLTDGNDGTQMISPWCSPPQLFKSKLRSLMVANSIETYTELLQKHIYEYGFADVNDYTKSVELIMDDKIRIKRTWNEDFYIPTETGALTHPNLSRAIVQYAHRNNRTIDTENFSSLENHVEFTDVDYADIRETYEFRELVNSNDVINNIKILDYEENWLAKKRAEKQKMKYKKATDKRTPKKRKK